MKESANKKVLFNSVNSIPNKIKMLFILLTQSGLVATFAAVITSAF